MAKILISMIFLFLFNSCAEDDTSVSDEMEVNVIRTYHDYYISSASGVKNRNHSLYVIGDDIPWLLEIDYDYNLKNKFDLADTGNLVNGRTPKALKADFESLGFLNDSNLLVLSSGSVNHTRDTAYIFNIYSHTLINKKNIRPLYESIKEYVNMSTENEINLEGLAISDNNVYLFHRGNVSENFIIQVNKLDFDSYMYSSGTIPSFEAFWFDLPTSDGVISGFSGACMHPNDSAIIFCASLEKSDNEVNDGEIVGSYVGYIPLTTLSEGKYTATLLRENDEVSQYKIEGLCFKDSAEGINNLNYVPLLGVVDNDDGTSYFLELQMTLK
ncbi:MAG: hypothetical protein CMF58_02550 [Lentimicrobiaceae bacterium]|jgi:hypothetical protein|nr:hypothetical protein [Lentimicrobiaceae bacterium]